MQRTALCAVERVSLMDDVESERIAMIVVQNQAITVSRGMQRHHGPIWPAERRPLAFHRENDAGEGSGRRALP